MDENKRKLWKIPGNQKQRDGCIACQLTILKMNKQILIYYTLKTFKSSRRSQLIFPYPSRIVIGSWQPSYLLVVFNHTVYGNTNIFKFKANFIKTE